MASRTSFAGFSKELIPFLEDLERHNTKKWFDAHRSDYETLYLEPAKAFATAVQAPLAKLHARSEPRVNGSIMRINRDTRFSKDKTPYKTALHFIFGGGEGEGPVKGSPGFYLRLGTEGLGMAAGLMGMMPSQLEHYRAAVADPKGGRALRAAIEKVRKAGPYSLPEPDLKRVPRGYEAEGPAAELLRFKSFYVKRDEPMPAALFGKDAVPFVIGRFREMRPVQKWLFETL